MICGQLGHFIGLFGVDERADVETAGAGVGVVGDIGADVVAETLHFVHVLGQMLDGNGRILDERNRFVVALDAT